MGVGLTVGLRKATGQRLRINIIQTSIEKCNWLFACSTIEWLSRPSTPSPSFISPLERTGRLVTFSVLSVKRTSVYSSGPLKYMLWPCMTGYLDASLHSNGPPSTTNELVGSLSMRYPATRDELSEFLTYPLIFLRLPVPEIRNCAAEKLKPVENGQYSSGKLGMWLHQLKNICPRICPEWEMLMWLGKLKLLIKGVRTAQTPSQKLALPGGASNPFSC